MAEQSPDGTKPDNHSGRMSRKSMFKIRNFSKAKLWVKVIAVGIPLVLVGYLVCDFIVKPWLQCGPDVARVEDQCIGVTDGSVVLRPELADVLDKIRQENERVESEDSPKVSIAYLLPLPKRSPDDELTVAKRLLHELQGAHIAQLQANRTKTLGEKPLIRLLVANSGEEASQRQRVVPTLLAKVNGPDRLVTVVATGNTVSGTLAAINDLRAGELPVVMSRLAGDSLATPDPNLQGALARLAPSGREQAATAAVYLKPTTRRALIVRDMNPEDPFIQGLDESFRDKFPDETHTLVQPSETYDSRLDGSANAMIGILRNICLQKPDVVYFAGRAPALEEFVQALPRRPCLEHPINVMASGGSTVALAVKIAQGHHELTEGMKANASVRYTAQAHPRAWVASPKSFTSASTSHLSLTCDYCFTTVFHSETLEDLEDGGAIVGYDAIVTAVAAIRLDHESQITVTPKLVSQQLKRLHGADAVSGAAGWISLDPDGNPVNKAVVILEVKSDGTLSFLELSSPIGSPCVRNVLPC